MKKYLFFTVFLLFLSMSFSYSQPKYSISMLSTENDYVECLNTEPGFQITNGLTVENWVYINSNGQANTLISKLSNTNFKGFELAMHANMKTLFRVGDGVSGYVEFQSANDFPEYEWHHVAVTIEETSLNNYTIKFYIDGVLDVTRTHSGALALNNSTKNLKFGYSESTTKYYTGYLDNIRIWCDVVRDQPSIFSSLCLTTDLGATAQYFFDDQTANDYISGINGTNNGGVYTTVAACSGASLATLGTTTTSNLTTTSVRATTQFTNDGGNALTKLGVCWNTSTGPTILNNISEMSSPIVVSTNYDFDLTGLAPNTKYYIKPYAENSAGTAYGTEIEIVTPPTAPTGLSATSNAAGTSLAVTWTDLAGSESETYTLEYSTDPLFGTIGGTQSGLTSSNYTITGLTPNTKYYYRVSTTNSGGTSATTSSNQTTISKAPTATVATGIDSDQLQANWTAPTLQGSETYTYTIQLDTENGFNVPLTATFNNITDLYKAFTGLSQNLTYYYRVRVNNAGGDGVWSNIITVKTVLTAPTLNTATITNNNIIVDWNTDVNAVTYDVEFFDKDGNSLGVQSVSAPLTDLTYSPLSPNTKYSYRVRSVNANGNGEWTSTQDFVTLPDAPIIQSETSLSTSGFTANWTAPTIPGSETYTYTLLVDDNNTFTTPDTYSPLTSATLSQVISSLAANTNYYYKVQCVNVTGASAWSSIESVTTVSTAPSSLNETGVTTTGFTANWTAPAGNGTVTYDLIYSTTSDFSSGNITLSNLNTSSQAVTGLDPNTKYYYKVRTVNAGGSGIWSTAENFITKPNAPTATAATGIDSDQLQANWTAPTLQGSETYTYSIEFDVDNTFNSATMANNINSATLLKLYSLLDPNTTYYYRIKCVNAEQSSSWSNTITILTLLPAPPVNASSNVQNNGFTVNWSNISGADKYQIEYSTDPTFTSSSSTTVNAPATTANLSPLNSNTKYFYRIRAIDVTGLVETNGEWANGPSYVYTKPEDPTSVVESNTTTTGFTLDWSDLSDANLADNVYDLEIYTTFDFSGSPVVTANGLTSLDYNASGLVNNTKYYYRIKTRNSNVESGLGSGWTTGDITTKASCSISSSNITSNSGIFNGAVAVAPASVGGTESITARGFVWSSGNSNPTIGGANCTQISSGTGTGTFGPTTINFPIPGFTYYVVSYATNAGGTTYCTPISITTDNAPYQDDASISLNLEHNSGWNDNNNLNTDPSIPNNNNIPYSNTNDSDFPMNPLNGSGNWQSWEFDGSNGECMSIPYNSNSGRLNNNSEKALFLYFKTGANIINRQVLLELGSYNSGFNAYIYSGKIWVGIWNSSQRRYFSKSISTNTVFLLNMEYNGSKVRTALNGECSSSMLFSGFAANSNVNGIGASVNGTRYMDLTRSSGNYDYLTGKIAEVLLYNDCSQTLRTTLMHYFDNKYGKSYYSDYTEYFGKIIAESNWTEFELEVSPFDNNDNLVSNLEVYKSQKDLVINLNLDEADNIELAIFDLSGKKVAIIENGELKKGINNFTYSTESLISGVYIVRAIGLNVNESVKINIVK